MTVFAEISGCRGKFRCARQQLVSSAIPGPRLPNVCAARNREKSVPGAVQCRLGNKCQVCTCHTPQSGLQHWLNNGLMHKLLLAFARLISQCVNGLGVLLCEFCCKFQCIKLTHTR